MVGPIRNKVGPVRKGQEDETMKRGLIAFLCIMAFAGVFISSVLSEEDPSRPTRPLPTIPAATPARSTTSGAGRESTKTYTSPDGYILIDYESSEDVDCAKGVYLPSQNTWGYAEVDPDGPGGYGYAMNGFFIDDDGLGDYDHAKYRYYVDYDDQDTGARAWAYCRMYLRIWKKVGNAWSYVGGNNKVYDSSYDGYDTLEADYDFQAGTLYRFELFAYNYAKAYEGFARSDTDPHDLVYLKLS
jgi:hypothetical protein